MKITEEMVEKACIAEGGQAYWDELQEGGPFDSMHTRHRARSMMRRALEAVAPLIVEECAKVIDDAARVAQALLLGSSDGAHCQGNVMHAHMRTAAILRDMIRALAKEP